MKFILSFIQLIRLLCNQVSFGHAVGIYRMGGRLFVSELKEGPFGITHLASYHLFDDSPGFQELRRLTGYGAQAVSAWRRPRITIGLALKGSLYFTWPLEGTLAELEPQDFDSLAEQVPRVTAYRPPEYQTKWSIIRFNNHPICAICISKPGKEMPVAGSDWGQIPQDSFFESSAVSALRASLLSIPPQKGNDHEVRVLIGQSTIITAYLVKGFPISISSPEATVQNRLSTIARLLRDTENRAQQATPTLMPARVLLVGDQETELLARDLGTILGRAVEWAQGTPLDGGVIATGLAHSSLSLPDLTPRWEPTGQTLSSLSHFLPRRLAFWLCFFWSGTLSFLLYRGQTYRTELANLIAHRQLQQIGLTDRFPKTQWIQEASYLSDYFDGTVKWSPVLRDAFQALPPRVRVSAVELRQKLRLSADEISPSKQRSEIAITLIAASPETAAADIDATLRALAAGPVGRVPGVNLAVKQIRKTSERENADVQFTLTGEKQ